MPLLCESKRKKPEILQARYPGAMLLDITSTGEMPWRKFSPFYPPGNLPVPFSPGYVSASVEGIWQGLKVFESAGVDVSKFSVTTMKGLKRSVRTNGKVLGHRKGVEGGELLPYREARYQIYLPTYLTMLETAVREELEELRRLSRENTVVLLDYEMNADVEDLSRPLSHASLIVHYIEGDWPQA